MKSSFCIDLQRFMLIPTKFPLTHELKGNKKYINKKIPAASPKRKPRGNTPVGVDGFEPPTLCL